MKVGVRYWYKKGVALTDAGLPERAVGCFDRALADNPGDTAILSKKAIALFYSGRLEEAAGLLDIILEEEPLMYSALNNMGMVLLRLNRVDEAWEFLEKAREASGKKGCADLNASLIMH